MPGLPFRVRRREVPGLFFVPIRLGRYLGRTSFFESAWATAGGIGIGRRRSRFLHLEDAAQSAEDDEPAWEPSPEPAHEEPEASVAEKPLQVRQAVPQEIPVETEKPSEKPIAEPVAPMAAVVPVSMPEPAVVVEAAPESAPKWGAVSRKLTTHPHPRIYNGYTSYVWVTRKKT
jgi:hypothetical protein